MTRLETYEVTALVNAGFDGFLPVSSLRISDAIIPAVRGVYVLLRISEVDPVFVAVGTGGHFKGKDPNVAVPELHQNWVSGATVVYIGKAGDPGSAATLRSRLKQYLSFGARKNIGHWGGRYIWQLADAEELVVAWKELPDGKPTDAETELIAGFKAVYGQRPFANLRD